MKRKCGWLIYWLLVGSVWSALSRPGLAAEGFVPGKSPIKKQLEDPGGDDRAEAARSPQE